MGFFSKVAGWIGNNWQGIANVGLGIANAINSNKNTDKALAAQSAENQKMREHNEYLSDKQNSANVAQWMRENAYNHPAAQKSRYEQAGLNADMMYGGGVPSASAVSPSMTGGAPAQSMDWSSLANKKTVGQVVLDNLAIAQARANVRKTNAEADIQQSDSSVRDELNQLGLNKLNVDYDVADELSNLYQAQTNGVDLDNDVKNWKRDLRKTLGEKYVSSIVEKVANDAEISKQQLEFEIETLAQRIVGTNAENTPLVNINNLSNQNLKLILEVLRTLLGK